jgi:hypothetical protein
MRPKIPSGRFVQSREQKRALNKTEVDLSKRAAIIVLDLAAKLFSAIALVALGFAGWQLQSQSQQRMMDLQQVDRAAQRILPLLQTLSQIQLSVSRAALEIEKSASQSDIIGISARIGALLQFNVDALFVPQDIQTSKKKTMQFDYLPLSDFAEGASNAPVELGLAEHTAAVADLLQMQPWLKKEICAPRAFENGTVSLRKPSSPNQTRFNATLYFQRNKDVPLPGDAFLYLTPKAVAAWRKLLPEAGMAVQEFCRLNLRDLLFEVAKASGVIYSRQLVDNPDIAEKAAALRMDVMRLNDPLVTR